ncbi:MAG: DNA repair protein RecN, partial [Syntrophales bacterium]
EEIGRIRAEMGGMEADLRRKAEALSSARREKAAILKKAVQGELRSLRMEQAAFDIVFSGAHTGEGMPELNARGCDTVEFYFSANAGEQMKALRRIASGGELSRIVLALKKVLAGADSAGTLIFDEVDSGIGGAVAEVVGEKLRDVAKGRQVLCITHLPQIASFAERHYLVTKETTSGRTVSRVRTLDGRERLEEIARMLGGVDITGETRAHAKEVLKKARRDGR